MSYVKNIVDIANPYLSFLNYLDNVVFWVTAYDYGKQYYLTNAYETIWERPAKEIMKSTKTWEDTILPEDLATIMDEMNLRTENKGRGVSAYRIWTPNGEIKYMKNIAHTFTNEAGKPLIIAGVDECLSQEQWENWQLNIASADFVKKDNILSSFQMIIEKNLNPSIIMSNSSCKEANLRGAQKIQINGREISISKRESECLNYLLQGLSAKQTAYLLQLSVRTVECYLETLRKKTNCRTKLALIGCLNSCNIR